MEDVDLDDDSENIDDATRAEIQNALEQYLHQIPDDSPDDTIERALGIMPH